MPTAAEEQNGAAQSEPPAKRRRGGRRSMNPDISAEERKRLRVLKNRESAMRSLAKKAEYSAKLETQEKEVVQEYNSRRDNLQSLVSVAIDLRTALEKVPMEYTKLMADAQACITKATTVLADADTAQPLESSPNVAEAEPDSAVNGESPTK